MRKSKKQLFIALAMSLLVGLGANVGYANTAECMNRCAAELRLCVSGAVGEISDCAQECSYGDTLCHQLCRGRAISDLQLCTGGHQECVAGCTRIIER
jgi:hypothetical protein